MFNYIPNYDIILIYMRSKMAPMKNTSISHHHTSPAPACFRQRWRQPRLGHGGESHGQMFFTPQEPQRRSQVPRRRTVLHKDRDVQEAVRTGQGLQAAQRQMRLTAVG